VVGVNGVSISHTIRCWEDASMRDLECGIAQEVSCDECFEAEKYHNAAFALDNILRYGYIRAMKFNCKTDDMKRLLRFYFITNFETYLDFI
jgi:hypothetical protein